MTPRDYQEHAIQAILSDLHVPGNSVACLATGAGKSLIISEIVKRTDISILILAPSKEITEQNLEKIIQHCPREKVGVYSASMNEKTVKQITLCTILSVRKSPELFQKFPLVIVDECHLVDVSKLDEVYTDFFRDIGYPKVIGLTATPFRLTKSYNKNAELVTSIKVITRIRGKNPKCFWDRILTNVTTKYLIEQGYLHKPKYFDNTKIQHEYIPTNKSKSDFNLKEYEEMILPNEEGMLDGISRLSAISHSVLVFCISVEQCERFAAVVKNSAVVSATTPKKDRERIIGQFKEGIIKVVFNVGTLTTGFDHPRLDGIVLIRPTRSLALYCQMLGRIMRKHTDKEIARIVDYSGTVRSLGHADSIEIYRFGSVLWDLRSDKQEHWHGRLLYSFKPQGDTQQSLDL